MATLCEPNRDEEIELRLRNHYLSGVALYSEYAGLDCPREALSLGMEALKQICNLGGTDGAWNPVWVGHTCDKGTIQKRLQVETSAMLDNSDRCHFEDILHRLPDVAQQRISAAGEAYDAIAKWLINQRKWLFTNEATSYC